MKARPSAPEPRDPRGAAAGEVAVFPSASALAEAAAERFARCAERALRSRGRCCVALSGGSTPAALYALLATERYVGRIDWSRLHVFWGDERCVPPDDPSSNYHTARVHLLERVPLPAENLHRIRGEDPPEQAAQAYERTLRAAFSTPDGPPRAAPGARFDLVLLGLGRDGHTASLFPGSSALAERERWVVAQPGIGAAPWRISLTPPVIEAAAEIRFLVAGAEKAAMLRQVLEGPWQPEALPAQRIAPRAGRLGWLVDRAAASQLERRGRAGSAAPG